MRKLFGTIRRAVAPVLLVACHAMPASAPPGYERHHDAAAAPPPTTLLRISGDLVPPDLVASASPRSRSASPTTPRALAELEPQFPRWPILTTSLGFGKQGTLFAIANKTPSALTGLDRREIRRFARLTG